MIPDTRISLEEDNLETFYNFIDALEELDDVQNVFTNLEYPE